jgi:hypothetical protein
MILLCTVTLNLGESASAGTGIWISTLFAVERLLNWLFAYAKKTTVTVCKEENTKTNKFWVMYKSNKNTSHSYL